MAEEEQKDLGKELTLVKRNIRSIQQSFGKDVDRLDTQNKSLTDKFNELNVTCQSMLSNAESLDSSIQLIEKFKKAIQRMTKITIPPLQEKAADYSAFKTETQTFFGTNLEAHNQFENRITSIESFDSKEGQRFNALHQQITDEFTQQINIIREQFGNTIQATKTELMKAVSDSFRQAQENISHNAQLIEQQTTRSDRIVQRIENHQESIQQLQADSNAMKETAAQYREELSKHESYLTEYGKHISALEVFGNKVDEDLKQIHTSIASLESQCENIRNANADDTAAWNARITESENNQHGFSTQLYQKNKKVSQEINQSLSNLQEEVTNFKTQTDTNFNSTKKETDDIRNIIVNLENEINASIDELKSDNVEMKSIVEAGNKRNEEIANKMAFIQGEEDISLTDMNNIIVKMRASVQETVEKNNQIVDKIRSETKENVNRAISTCDEKVTSISSQFQDLTDGTAKSLQKIKNSILDTINKANEPLIADISNQTKRLDTLCGESVMTIDQIITKLGEIEDHGSQLSKTVADEVKRIDFLIQDTIQNDENGRNLLLKQITSNKSEADKQNEDMQTKIAERLNKSRNSIKDLNQKVDSNKEEIETAMRQNKIDGDGKIKSLENQIGIINESLEDSKQTTLENIKEAKVELTAQFESKSQSLSADIIGLRNILSSIQGSSGITLDDMIKSISKMKEDNTKLIDQNNESIKQKFTEMKTQIEAFNGASDNRIQELSGKFQDILKGNQKMIDEAADKNTIMISDSKKEMIEQISSVRKQFDSFVGGVSSTFPELIESFNEFQTNASEKIKQLSDRIKAQKQDAKETNSQILSEVQSIKETTESNNNQLTSRIEDNNQLFAEIKKSIETNKQQNESALEKEITTITDLMNQSSELQAQREENTKAEIEAIHKTIAEVEEQFSKNIEQSINKSESSISGRITKIRTGMQTLQTLFDKFAGADNVSLPELIKKISLIETKCERILKENGDIIDQKTQEIAEKIGIVQATSNENYTNLNEKIKEEVQKFNSKSEQANQKLEKRINQFSETSKEGINTIQQSITELRAGTKLTLKDVSLRIEEVNQNTESVLHSHSADIADLQQKAEKVVKDVSDQVINTIRVDLTSMNDSNQALDESIKACKTKIDSLPSKKDYHVVVSRLNEIQGETQETFPSIIDKLKETENNIKIVSEQCNLNAEKLIQDHEAKTEDITSIIRTVIMGANITLAQAGEEITKLGSNLQALTQKQNEFESNSTTKIIEMNKTLKSSNKEFSDALVENKSLLATIEHKLDQSIESIQLESKEKLQLIAQTSKEQIAETRKSMQEALSKHDIIIADLQTSINERGEDQNSIVSSFKKKFEKIDKDVKHIDQRLTQHAEEQKSDQDALRVQQKNDFKNNNEAIIRNIEEKIDVHLKTFSDSSTENNLKVVKDINELKESILAISGGSNSTISNAIEQIAQLKKTIDISTKERNDHFADFSGEVKKLIEASETESNKKFTKIDAKFEQTDEFAAQLATQLKSKLRSTKTEILDEVRNSEARSKASLDEFIHTHSDEHKNSKVQTDSKIKQIEDTIYANQNSFSELQKQVTLFDEKQSIELASFMTQAAKTVKSHIKDALTKQNDSFEEMKQNMDEEKEKIEKSIQSAHDEMTEMKNHVNKQISANGDNVSSVLKECREMTSDVVKRNSGQIESIVARFSSLENQLPQLKNEILENKTSQEALLSQMKDRIETLQSLTKSRLDDNDKRIQTFSDSTSKKFDDYSRASSKANAELMNANAEELKKQTANLENSFNSFKEKLSGDVSEASSKQRQFMSDFENKLREMKNEQLQHNGRISGVEKSVSVNSTSFETLKKEITTRTAFIEKDTQEGLSRIAAENSKLIQVSQRLEEAMNSMTKGFATVKEETRNIQKKCENELEVMKRSVDAATNDIASLQHIHKFNADFEVFYMKFEQTLSNIQNFQKTISSFIFPECQGIRAENASPKKPKMLKTKIPHVSRSERFEIPEISNDVEIGSLLRRTLLEHQHVSLTLPPRAKVTWTKPLMMAPHQTVSIQCADKSAVILMDGKTRIGSLDVPTRVIIDGFSVFRCTGVKIQARTSCENDTPIQDLSSLFVLRSYDAAGPSSVQFRNCEIETDVSIANAGGSAVAHVNFIDSRIACASRSRNITLHPVTAVNGGFDHGYAFITKSNVKLSDRQISWLEDTYIVDESQE